MLSVPSALVRVAPAESGAEAAAQRAVSWAMPRSGSGSASVRSSSASTIASTWRAVSWRLASPTGLLAPGVGPAGGVGDQLAVVADEPAAADMP